MKHMTRFSNVPFVVSARELWQKGVGCDVNLFVGFEKEHFLAHRLILAASSEYFCNVLYNDDLKNSINLNVEIPSVAADTFATILEFMYSTQKIDTPLISNTNFVPLYFTAKAYGINPLAKACRHYLKRMSADDCLLILDQSVLQNEKEIMDSCLRHADSQPDNILHCEGLLDCSWSTLKILFERESFEPSSQFGVFMALLSWSIAECERRDLDITPENERRVLGNLLDVIRQGSLSVDEKDDIARAGLLPEGTVAGYSKSGMLDQSSSSNDLLYNSYENDISSIPELGNLEKAKATSSVHSEDDFCSVASTSESPTVLELEDRSSAVTPDFRTDASEKVDQIVWNNLHFATIERETVGIERSQALHCPPMAPSEQAKWSYEKQTDDLRIAAVVEPPDILYHHEVKVGLIGLENLKFAQIKREATDIERTKLLRNYVAMPAAERAEMSYEQQTDGFGVAEVNEPPKVLFYEPEFPKTTSPKLARKKLSKENIRNHIRSRTEAGSKSPKQKFSFSGISDGKQATIEGTKPVISTEGDQSRSPKLSVSVPVLEDQKEFSRSTFQTTEEIKTKPPKPSTRSLDDKDRNPISEDVDAISKKVVVSARKTGFSALKIDEWKPTTKAPQRVVKSEEHSKNPLTKPIFEIDQNRTTESALSKPLLLLPEIKSDADTKRNPREVENTPPKQLYLAVEAQDRKSIIADTKRLFEELVAKSETSAPVKARVNQLLTEPSPNQSSIKRRWSARHSHQPRLEVIEEKEENNNPKKLHTSRTWSTLAGVDFAALHTTLDNPQKADDATEHEQSKPMEIPTIVIEQYKGVGMRGAEAPNSPDPLGQFSEQDRTARREALQKELKQLHSLHAETGSAFLEVEDENASNFTRRNSMTRAEALRLASKILHTTEPGEKPSLAPLQRSVKERRSFYVKPKAADSESQIKQSTADDKPVSAKTIKERLLMWCQWATKNYPVTISNFSSSWADGMAFCALAHRFASRDTSFDFNSLNPQEREKNLQLAFDVAEANGVVPLLEVEDMIIMGDKPDWKCIFVYVQSFYRHFKDRS